MARRPSRFRSLAGRGVGRGNDTAESIGSALSDTEAVAGTGTARLLAAPILAEPRLSIVVPALNEADNISAVMSRIPEDVFEVILVDGWSSDATVSRAVACRPDVRVVRQTRFGKGNALACGFAACRGDIIVMLDADGSADPAEVPRFVKALQNGADFAKGTRFSAGGASEDITAIRRMGNWCLNRLVNRLYKTGYTDLCYGYMAFWASCLPVLAIAEEGFHVGRHGEVGQQLTDPRPCRADVMRWGDGFEIETLITVRAAAGGLRIAEVGSVEARRVHGVSNLNAVSDGLRVLRTIAAENYRLRQAGGLSGIPVRLAPGGVNEPPEELMAGVGHFEERVMPMDDGSGGDGWDRVLEVPDALGRNSA